MENKKEQQEIKTEMNASKTSGELKSEAEPQAQPRYNSYVTPHTWKCLGATGCQDHVNPGESKSGTRGEIPLLTAESSSQQPRLIMWVEPPSVKYSRDKEAYTVRVQSRFQRPRYIRELDKVPLSNPIKLEELKLMLDTCQDLLSGFEIGDLKYIIGKMTETEASSKRYEEIQKLVTIKYPGYESFDERKQILEKCRHIMTKEEIEYMEKLQADANSLD